MSASDTVYLTLVEHDRPVPTAHICAAVHQVRRSQSGDDVLTWLRYLERSGHVRRVEVDGVECWECVPESWARYTGRPVGDP